MAEAPKYKDYYDAVRTWLWNARDKEKRRCLGAGLDFLAASDPQRSVDDLIRFAEQWSDETIDVSHVTTLSSFGKTKEVVGALSLALATQGLTEVDRQRAFDYLVESSVPSNWSRRDLSWSWSDEMSRDMAFVLLAHGSVAALARSGHPSAPDALRELAENKELAATYPSPQTFAIVMDGFIELAHSATMR